MFVYMLAASIFSHTLPLQSNEQIHDNYCFLHSGSRRDIAGATSPVWYKTLLPWNSAGHYREQDRVPFCLGGGRILYVS